MRELLEKLLKIKEITYKEEGIFSFLITPKGEKIDVPNNGEHLDIIIKYPEKFGFPKFKSNNLEDLQVEGRDPLDMAIDKGTIAVNYIPKTKEVFIISKKINKKDLNILLNYLPFIPKEVIWSDLKGEKEVVLEDFI